MNRDWQEKEIRQLFRKERQANESVTPDFAITLEAALSKKRERPRGLILRFAFAVVALVAIAVSVFLFVGRNSREQAPSVAADPSESIIKPAAPQTGPASLLPEEPAKPVRLAHRHRQSTRRAAPLISQWRSPTEFLLRTPGDELLRSVPRLGVSAVEIKLDLSSPRN
jgi:hypothetical protein